MVLALGQWLGPYEILAFVGAGGMGEVYRARDSRLDRAVAVKVIRHDARDGALRERFEREARVAATLSHPNVCTLHDVGLEGYLDYLVMEYIDGATLASRLERGPLPTDEALTLAIQLADAIDAAHRHGIVHRDLKPGNIMLTRAGAKLLDFGLARSHAAVLLHDVDKDAPAATATVLTAHGTILGSLNYMGPGQVQGDIVDFRADIFAFGAVLYETLAGRRAFDGANPASVIAAILEKQPPVLSTVQPLAPPALDHVVQRCLVKDVSNRWQSARDLFHELIWVQRGLEQRPEDRLDPRTGHAAGASRGWTMVPWAIAVIALMAAATAGWLATRTQTPIAPSRRLTVVLPEGDR